MGGNFMDHGDDRRREDEGVGFAVYRPRVNPDARLPHVPPPAAMVMKKLMALKAKWAPIAIHSEPDTT